MSLPAKLVAWAGENNGRITDAEAAFCDAVDRLSRAGVGFGFMQQVCEWMWQDFCARLNLPGGAWGPEYFNEKIAKLERTQKDLLAFAKLIATYADDLKKAGLQDLAQIAEVEIAKMEKS